MKKAAVVIDKWKLSIFDKHLRAAGYSYETLPGVTAGTHTLKVAYEWVAELKPVIEAAQAECVEVEKGKSNG